jgi:hypothetical protein
VEGHREIALTIVAKTASPRVMSRARHFVLSCVGVALVACGGSGSTDETGGGDVGAGGAATGGSSSGKGGASAAAGKSGSSTGGTAAGGKSGAAGAGASSGSAGQSTGGNGGTAGQSTGGASGKAGGGGATGGAAGNGTGGQTTGGAAGSAGKATGGSSAGGASTGGASAGGKSGAAGAGATAGAGGGSTGGTGGASTGGTGGASAGGSSTGGSSTAGAAGSTATGGAPAGGASGTGGASAGASGSGGSGGAPCTAGTIICEGNTAKTCDGNGGFSVTTACAQACSPDLGCTACVPFTGSCVNDTASLCKPDGSGYTTDFCDPVQGQACNPQSFSCTGACSSNSLSLSYLGCEYWPTTVANVVWSVFDFAVAVAVPAGGPPANVTVTRGANAVTTASIPAGSLQIIRLPWVPEIKGAESTSSGGVNGDIATVLAKAGAYRLRTDTPVAVYQFNALDYKLDPSNPKYASCPGLQGGIGCFSFTNDASLLLPTNALTGNYMAFTYPSWDAAKLADYAAITATKDNTTVTFTSSTNIQAGGGVPALGPGGKTSVKLDRGDVLQIMAATNGDISGSTVAADQPVQVIAGLPCVNIPTGSAACDHIEESVLPLETLGKEYVMTAPHPQGGTANYELRIHGVKDGTVVTVDPAIGGKTTFNLNAGQTQSFTVTADYHLTANQAFYVSQYMVGQTVAGVGDPSQSNGVPTAQYRSSYTFLAPTTYDLNYVNVTVATGTAVTLDGAPVPGASFKPIGGSAFSVATLVLSNAQSHSISSSGGTAGIIVYGYGQYTSYMYPGGLDLTR